MAAQEEHSETMCDQEENNNNNITYNTYVQIGARNQIQSTNEQTGNMEYDVEKLKVTVAAQGQKLENQATQLNALAEQLKAQAAQVNTQAGQLKAQAEQLKVHDSMFKQQPANQQINSQQLASNCIVTLHVYQRLYYGKEGEIQVAKNITVGELKVKLQQQYEGGSGVIVIYSNKKVVYNGVTREGDSTRTLTSLGVQDGYKVHCW